eukprot:1096876-Rhodomonas_salina.1
MMQQQQQQQQPSSSTTTTMMMIKKKKKKKKWIPYKPKIQSKFPMMTEKLTKGVMEKMTTMEKAGGGGHHHHHILDMYKILVDVATIMTHPLVYDIPSPFVDNCEAKFYKPALVVIMRKLSEMCSAEVLSDMGDKVWEEIMDEDIESFEIFELLFEEIQDQ